MHIITWDCAGFCACVCAQSGMPVACAQQYGEGMHHATASGMAQLALGPAAHCPELLAHPPRPYAPLRLAAVPS